MSIKLFINKPLAYKTLQCFLPLSLQNDCLCSHGKSVSKKGMGRTIGRGCPVLKLFSLATVKSFGKSNFYKPPQFKKKKYSAYFRPDQNRSNKTTEGRVALLLWNTSFSNPVLLSSQGLS